MVVTTYGTEMRITERNAESVPQFFSALLRVLCASAYFTVTTHQAALKKANDSGLSGNEAITAAFEENARA